MSVRRMAISLRGESPAQKVQFRPSYLSRGELPDFDAVERLLGGVGIAFCQIMQRCQGRVGPEGVSIDKNDLDGASRDGRFAQRVEIGVALDAQERWRRI